MDIITTHINADFDGLVRSALRGQFPEVSGRSERRELYRLVSIGAGYQMQDMIEANPELLATEWGKKFYDMVQAGNGYDAFTAWGVEIAREVGLANRLHVTPPTIAVEATFSGADAATLEAVILPEVGNTVPFRDALDDLVIASFVSGPGASTLPMYIFSKVKLGVSPDINALATLIIAVITLGLLAAWLAMRRVNR